MTKEELKNIGDMPFKEVCKFLFEDDITILAKNLMCIKCPLFRSDCSGRVTWDVCEDILKNFMRG